MEQCWQIAKPPLDKTLNHLPNYIDRWIFATFSPYILDVCQTFPPTHKTFHHSSSLFVYVANIHFMDSGMTNLKFGPQSLEAWSWKHEWPRACRSFTNYKLHFFYKNCDLLVVLAWKLVAYCLIFILSNFRVHCSTFQN
jgi:hypothetical protein